MSSTKNIITSSYLKENMASVIKNIPEIQEPLLITHNGEVKLVVESPESYQEKLNIINMLKIITLREREKAQGQYEDFDMAIADITK